MEEGPFTSRIGQESSHRNRTEEQRSSYPPCSPRIRSVEASKNSPSRIANVGVHFRQRANIERQRLGVARSHSRCPIQQLLPRNYVVIGSLWESLRANWRAYPASADSRSAFTNWAMAL